MLMSPCPLCHCPLQPQPLSTHAADARAQTPPVSRQSSPPRAPRASADADQPRPFCLSLRFPVQPRRRSSVTLPIPAYLCCHPAHPTHAIHPIHPIRASLARRSLHLSFTLAPARSIPSTRSSRPSLPVPARPHTKPPERPSHAFLCITTNVHQTPSLLPSPKHSTDRPNSAATVSASPPCGSVPHATKYDFQINLDFGHHVQQS
jgi:hypothetical protein